MSAPEAKARPSRRLALTLALLVAGGILAYATVSEVVASLLAKRDPQLAVRIRPDLRVARQARAQEQLGEAISPEAIDRAEAEARQQLRWSPVAADALANLGQVAQARGDLPNAVRLMQSAARRSVRTSSVEVWLADWYLRRGDLKRGYRHADLLLRRRPDMNVVLDPMLVRSLAIPGAMTLMAEQLVSGQTWRNDFLYAVARSGDPLDPSARLYRELKRSKRPANAEEVAIVAVELVSAGRYADAHRFWTEFTPTAGAQPLLADGGFESAHPQPPFSWRLIQANGALASVETSPAGTGRAHALYVEYPAAQASQLAEQLIVLDPGSYRLSYKVKVERLPEDAAFVWRVACVDGRQLVSAAENKVGDWRAGGLTVNVPADCPAQMLSLSGALGARFDPASAWFDDMAIERISPAPAGVVAG